MSETVKDFEAAVIKKNITKWSIWPCSMCNYPCGFLFLVDGKKVKVGYDSGCYCCGRGDIRAEKMESVKEHYDLQSNQKLIDEYDQFWGFEGVSDE